MAEFFGERQYWRHWPKTLVMHKRIDAERYETMRYVPEGEHVDIVRCRDCVDYDCGRCYSDQWSTASLMPAHRVGPDGFCAWGERKPE